MAKWPDNPVYTPLSEINKGNEYEPADGIVAKDINAFIENVDYLNKTMTDSLNLLEAKLNENIVKDPSKTYLVWKGSKFSSSYPTSDVGFSAPAGSTIDWGDGTIETFETASTEFTTHAYTDGIEYHLIVISGLSYIYPASFSHYNGLISIAISNNINELRNSVFTRAINLVNVIIPNSVTSIGYGVFTGCSGLTSITIPNSVTSIDAYAFGECDKLKKITINATNPPSIDDIFSSTIEKIIVPKSAINAYKAATGWSQYADKIVYEVDSSDIDKAITDLDVDNIAYKNKDNIFKNSNYFEKTIKVQSAPVDDDDVVRKKELNMKTSQEVFIGESLPTGADARIWIDTAVSTSELSKIYGVDEIGQANPKLRRTDDAKGLTYTIGTSGITSDFDNCYPWSNMQEVTDSSGNVFIKIPKFYSKVTKNTDGTYKYQISGTRHKGFITLFVDGKGNELDYVLVGKYEGSGSASRIYSKSGATVLVNITCDNFRIGCKANGKGYQQYDFLIDTIIKELFTIEFATTNSQSIMQGYTASSNVAAVTTGRTDTVKTASGSEISNTDGKHACKYRGIENPWGNIWTFVDGIAFSKKKIYECTDPTTYESGKVTAPYFYTGNRCLTSGYAKTIAPLNRNPLMFFTESVVGSATTYYSDSYYYADSGQILLVGGAWGHGLYAGLWFWSGNTPASKAHEMIGGRLCYKPIQN